ncbi:hypothetical protein O181_020780 [Austropuccinia psidii MF-1]|uniref:Uncharacterized protein n=1 Tax=Austropuccinia psidii MF-1 TaxID=1389203 RepID=A0A9Q3CEF2_9BASI|nr:hypothetical protein [Austropuccinia psidii MF-1]
MIVCCPKLPTTQARCCREGSFGVNNDESIPKREWTPGPQTGRQEQLRTIRPVPSSINLSTPLLGHHLMVTSLLDQSKVIIWLMKDGNGKRTFELGLIVTMSFHPWDSNAKNKTNQIPCNKTLPFLVCQPSQPNEPPIPGLSPSSKPHEDIPSCEPEPELVPLHPLHDHHRQYARRIPPPLSPSPRVPPPSTPTLEIPPISPRTQLPPPLIPTMRLARNSLTWDQH